MIVMHRREVVAVVVYGEVVGNRNRNRNKDKDKHKDKEVVHAVVIQ
jgi:hypothetical protein